VLVIDHAARAGEKIRISGGGRCNFTNLATAPDRFLSQNPRFAISALRRYTPQDFVARVTAAGIAWHEKTLGQLFCDGPATQVVAMLTGDLARAGGELWLSTPVGEVAHTAAGFTVATPRGLQRAARLIVATGGKSIPKMGATALGYRLAEQFGLPLVETRPALVPLTFAAQELAWMAPLAGLAVTARVRAGAGPAFDDGLLFTHRGLSGPAVLQISSYWREGEGVTLDLLPGQDATAVVRAARAQAGRRHLGAVLAGLMPERLARLVEARTGLVGPLAAQPQAALDRAAAGLNAWRLVPVGSEGYRTAEVTLGGVDTRALDGRTMEVRGLPGLHFVGEVVDVTGWLGGYNFQWAWSSGWVAGQSV
jgi:predicted Rossmann fold flavoprotein